MTPAPNRPWFGSIPAVAVAAMSVGGLLAGLWPMVRTLVITNQLIDDRGVNPGDSEIIAEWEAWAFTAKNFTLVILGVGGLVGVYVWSRYRKNRDRWATR
jgi:hypothetical protein